MKLKNNSKSVLPKSTAYLTYDQNKFLTKETEREYAVGEEFAMIFELNVAVNMLKFSIKFVSLTPTDSNEDESNEVFSKSMLEREWIKLLN